MKLLLDTHVLVWFMAEPTRLDERVVNALREGRASVLISVASWWELGIKHALGRLEGAVMPQQLRESWLDLDTVQEVSIRAEHVYEAVQLPPHHRDPFDRMIIAQARIEGATLISADAFVRLYDVPLMRADR